MPISDPDQLFAPKLITLRDGTVVRIRPIRPDDAPAVTELFAHLSREDVRTRFFAAIKELSPSLLARLTRLDYAREMALVASTPGSADLLGVVRLSGEPDKVRAEFAIVVRSDWKHHGLGHALMHEIVGYARTQGIAELFGTILAENQVMIDMARDFGFTVAADAADASLVTARRVLATPEAAADGASRVPAGAAIRH